MKNVIASGLLLFLLAGCSGLEEEVAGICVSCTIPGTPETTLVACSNGDGTITLTENGVETGTSEFDTETFRIGQESTGATCN